MNTRHERIVHISAGIILSASAAYLLRDLLLYSARLVSVSGTAALLLAPLCRLFEKKLSAAISAALAICAAILTALLVSIAIIIPILHGLSSALDILPFLASQAKPLLSLVPDDNFSFTTSVSDNLFQFIGSVFPLLFRKLFSVAGGIADILAETVITWYFLTDRKRIGLQIELLLPRKYRSALIRHAAQFRLEIGLFLKGQALIALCVGFLSAVGLLILRVPFSVQLGMTAGVLNMIPYLGPIIACIPVGLVSLSEGPLALLFSIGVLIAVQQIDGLVLSPRIVGNSTGLPPVLILIAVLSAGVVWGIIGMLIAVPSLILIRTCVRVFVELGHND